MDFKTARFCSAAWPVSSAGGGTLWGSSWGRERFLPACPHPPFGHLFP
ncbi:hypothetical protein LC55x_3502 [Lysobacter capsici]|nr:hypothetical protein LC55x_3502 [Lysobacter capsici]